MKLTDMSKSLSGELVLQPWRRLTANKRIYFRPFTRYFCLQQLRITGVYFLHGRLAADIGFSRAKFLRYVSSSVSALAGVVLSRARPQCYTSGETSY